MDTWYKQATGKSRDASTHSRSGKKIGSSQQRSQYNRLRAGEGGKEPSFVTSVAGGSTVRGTDSRSDDHDNPSYPLHAISVARTVDVV